MAIVRPELTVMQVEAIIHAAADFIEEDQANNKPRPRIMIPLIGSVAEYQAQATVVRSVAERVKKERKIEVPYDIGTMIEVPRATLISEKIAALCDDEVARSVDTTDWPFKVIISPSNTRDREGAAKPPQVGKEARLS